MPPRPVVAAPPFQSSCYSLNTSPRWWLFALLSWFVAATTFAQEAAPQEQRHVVDIELQTAQEEQLQPFVETVSYGPSLVKSLLAAGV